MRDMTHLCLFDKLLLIDLSQTQFALLVVQSESLLIFKRRLFRLLLPYHIIPHLRHNKNVKYTGSYSWNKLTVIKTFLKVNFNSMDNLHKMD